MLRSLMLRLGLPVARPAHGLATVAWHPGVPGASVTYYTVVCDNTILEYFYTGTAADAYAAELNAHPTRGLEQRPAPKHPVARPRYR